VDRSILRTISGGIWASILLFFSEWGTPNMVQHGLNPEILLKGGYGHKLHIWDLHKRRHLQKLDLGSEYQMALELRPAHNPTHAYGFLVALMI
jgi:selenium-binding protein 1